MGDVPAAAACSPEQRRDAATVAVTVLAGADAAAAIAAADAAALELRAKLAAAGARSFEGVFIDADGIARSTERGGDDHE
ncbi:MAG: hypothetical protein ABI551_11150 [Polyangiaceae bacterium]